MDEIDRIAADIAAKGRARADELEARVARLRERLADPAYLLERAEAQLRAEQEKFDWEREEEFPPEISPSIWAATAQYSATGEGLTTYYYATFARSEAEFRRKLAGRVDPYLADVAQLNHHLRAWVERRWRGGEFSVYGEHHVNCS